MGISKAEADKIGYLSWLLPEVPLGLVQAPFNPSKAAEQRLSQQS